MPYKLIHLLCLPVAPDKSLFCWLLLSVIFLLTFALFPHHWLPDVWFNQVQGSLLMCIFSCSSGWKFRKFIKAANLIESAPTWMSTRNLSAEWKIIQWGIWSFCKQTEDWAQNRVRIWGGICASFCLHLWLLLSVSVLWMLKTRKGEEEFSQGP